MVVTGDADNILQRAIQLANEGLEKRHMIADDIRNLTSDDILNLANDEFWQQLSRKEGEDMGFDKTEIALKFEKGITELCESHAAQRVGDYIDTLKVTPKESASLISRYFAKQGRGLPWGKYCFGGSCPTCRDGDGKSKPAKTRQNLREWFSKICL